MSGIRSSLVLLILLVSVISLFVLDQRKRPIEPGSSTPVSDLGTPQTSREPQTPNSDGVPSRNPEETAAGTDPVQIDPVNGGAAAGVPQEEPLNETFGILLRVMDSQGDPVQAGVPSGLFQSSGDSIESADPVFEQEVRGLWAGGDRSKDPASDLKVQIAPPVEGRWIIDTTLQKTDSDLLKLDRMILIRPESVDRSSLLVIPALTRAPVGSRLRIQVVGDGRTLDGGILKVTGEENLWELPLVPRQWYAGLLRVQVVWSWEAATVERQNQVLEVRGDEFAGEDWVWSGTLSVDTAAEAKRQGEKIRRWYRQLLDEVEMTRDLLLVAGAHARGKRARLVRDDERYSRLLTHPLAPVLDDLGRGARFDERRWRRLLDEELPQRWSPWVEEGAIPWPDRYPGPARNVPLLFHTLVKYSRLESTVIYLALGKERHPNDFVADFDWDPATERTQTLGKLRNFINAIREKLAELEED